MNALQLVLDKVRFRINLLANVFIKNIIVLNSLKTSMRIFTTIEQYDIIIFVCETTQRMN